MAVEVARLKAVIDAESKPAEEGVGRLHGILDKAKGAIGGLGAAFGILGGATVVGGIAFLGAQLADSVKQAAAANEVIDQTYAVLRSTGGAAGVTADMVDQLSNQYMNLTGIQDDTVRSAENMLLTFTNIHKDVFPKATQTALDMSVALKQDATQSSIMLGKALSDPIHGITALQRVGVTFDDKQKELIKTYVAHGQTAKAQGVILAELQKEFGGSAEAAGQANGGIKILTAQWDNMKQSIGEALIPVLIQLGSLFMPLIQQLAKTLPDAAGKAETFFTEHVMPTLLRVSDWIQHDGVPAFQKIAGFIMTNVVPAIQHMWTWAQQYIVPILVTLGNVVLNNVLPALQNIWAHISQSLIPALQRLWEKISPVLIPIFQTLGWVLQNVVGPALGIIIDVISHLIDLIATIIGKLGDFLGLLGNVKDAIGNGLGNLFNNFPHFAGGGTTNGGPFVGAEDGPELLLTPGVYNAPAGSRILNAADTRRALSGGGDGSGSTTVNNYNIYPAKERFTAQDMDLLQRRRAILSNVASGGI